MEALKKSDEKKHKDVCTKIREDGAYVEAGENDNLLVQKVSGEPGTLGVLGFSYLEENADKVKPVQIAGIVPDGGDDCRPSYPGARKLYIYLKGEHLPAKPAIKDFVAAYSQAVGHRRSAREARTGSVRRRGCGSGGKAGGELKPLDPSTLK